MTARMVIIKCLLASAGSAERGAPPPKAKATGQRFRGSGRRGAFTVPPLAAGSAACEGAEEEEEEGGVITDVLALSFGYTSHHH